MKKLVDFLSQFVYLPVTIVLILTDSVQYLLEHKYLVLFMIADALQELRKNPSDASNWIILIDWIAIWILLRILS